MIKLMYVRKPSDNSVWVGQSDLHELVTVIDYSKVSTFTLICVAPDIFGEKIVETLNDDRCYDTGTT